MNMLLLHCCKLNRVNYYQKKSGQEIDLIWKENCAVEIAITPTKNDAAMLTSRMKALGFKKKYLVGLYPPANEFKNFVWGGNIF
jgi:uncharacterized protein